MEDKTSSQRQKALFVEELNYEIDPNKFPANGHEYIHLVRREHESIFPESQNDIDCIPMFEIEDAGKKPKTSSLAEWKRNEAKSFSCMALKLNENRSQLMQKFPQKLVPSVEDEKEFCLFCLGSDLYQKIFIDETVDYCEGHLPVLSIVLYFSQEEIPIILGYLSNWVDKIGMNHTLGRWMYAILACLKKPVSDEFEEFLEDLYDRCRHNVRKCKKEEKQSLHLIMSILSNYFCVKVYKIGPSLDKFVPLC